jgi:polyisoprenoid-binding protein YceI
MSTTTIAPAETSTWNIDPAHSRAEFKVKHMMISNVKGSFTNLTGTLIEDVADPLLSQVHASIDIATVNTGDSQRDGHLKSADFFDYEKYREMTFVSMGVKATGKRQFEVTGDLSLHGVTKSVTFSVDGPSAPAKDPWGNNRIGLSATAQINRKDFGLVWNTPLDSGGILVGEEVDISLDVEFIKT